MSAPPITPDTPVGHIAARHPATVPHLWDLGLDFCCGGKTSLADACAQKALDLSTTMRRLEAALAAEDPEPGWEDQPLGELIDHLIDRYHAPLAGDLDRLHAMASKVLTVHGAKDPRLGRLVEAVEALRDELIPHLAKEEQILFPLIRAGRGRAAGGPIRVMHLEHDAAGALLTEVRSLTDDHRPPSGACATWRGLYAGLATFDRELMEHIHLENNILFPRALA